MRKKLNARMGRACAFVVASCVIALTGMSLHGARDLRAGTPDLIVRSSFEIGELSPRKCVGKEADGDNDGLVDSVCIQAFDPPNPRDVATPIDPTVPVDFDEVTEFLYSTPNPVQRGARREDIAPHRVAVIRGKVMNDQGAPLAGVLVRALDQPEIGYTYTRPDGIYDLAVNGGAEVVVDYQRNGFLRAQRRVNAPWRDWHWASDVRMIPLDPAATVVALGSTTPQQVVVGSTVVDADGSRQVSLIVPPGTQAEMVFSDGTRVPAQTLTVRATEYTVGPSGPERLPGSLPATSAYTYAVELSADEAVASGASSVEFSAPIAAYLHNFLSFPVGVHVPVGSYQFRHGQWLPEPNGRVVRVLSVAAGIASLDVDGTGTAATDAEYAALGISTVERVRLATMYAAGTELWRFTVRHFSPWDCNKPNIPNDDDEPPTDPPDQDPDDDSDDPDGDPCSENPSPGCDGGDDQGEDDTQDEEQADESCEQGSIIGCESGSLREDIALPGTGLTLTYDSRLVPARLEGVIAQRVRVTGSTVPPRLLRADVSVVHLGNRVERRIDSPQPNHHESIPPSITDAYGRPWTVPGRITASVRYHYPLRFAATNAEFGRAWARFGDLSPFQFDRDFVTRTYSIAADVRTTVAPVFSRSSIRAGWDARGQGFGGWTLRGHHVLDRETARIFGGGAAGRSALASNVTEISTSQLVLREFDRSDIRGARRVSVAADGSIFLLANNFYADAPKEQPGQNGVWRYTIDGRRELWADFCTGSYGIQCIDPDTGRAQLEVLRDIAVDHRGRPIVTDGRRIIRFDAVDDPVVLFDGKTHASACTPTRLAVSTERVYFACTTEGWVGAVWPDGQVSRVAGGGTSTADGTPAERIGLQSATELSIDAQQNLFVLDSAAHVIWKIQTNGHTSKVAGTGAPGFAPDGDFAAGSGIGMVTALLATQDGRVVFADETAQRLREIDASGRLRTIAGGGDVPVTSIERGTIARQLAFGVSDFSALPDGTVVHVSSGSPETESTIAALASSSFASFRGYRGSSSTLAIPSADGTLFHVFDQRGRHLETRRSDTGHVIRSFSYDDAGYVIGVIDGFGASTTIQRDALSRPTSITSPDGVTTQVSLDAAGNLASISLPESEQWVVSARPDGLVESIRAPNGGATTFQWFNGELSRHRDAEGGERSLGRTDWLSLGTTRRALTSPLGRARLDVVDRTTAGAIVRVQRQQGRMGRSITETASGTRRIVFEDGVRVEQTTSPDPRFGLPAAYPTSRRTELPEIGVRNELRSRTITPTVPDATFGQLDVTEVRVINSRAYSYDYSSAERRYRYLSPERREVAVDVTPAGRILRIAFPGIAPVEYTYDSRGRPSTSSMGEGVDRRTTVFTYDTNGFVHTIRDPLDRVTTLTKDGQGRTTTLRTADLRTVGYRYRAGGRIVGVTPPGRPEHQFRWDFLDQLKGYEPPILPGLGRVDTRMSYDADRQLRRIDRPDGLILDLGYDAASGLLTRTGDALTEVTLERDELGRVTRADVPAWTLVRRWRPAGLPLSESQGDYGAVAWEFDPNFWLSRVSVSAIGPESGRTDYSYDLDGLLVGARSFDGFGNLRASLRVLRRADNGLLSGTEIGEVSESWSHNHFAEPSNHVVASGGAEAYAAEYTRDKLGRITRVLERIGGQTHERLYHYDLTGRLEVVTIDGAPAARYAFDANGNRSRATYGHGPSEVVLDATHDAQDRLLTYGDYRYTWTANGNLASRTHLPSNSTLTTVYDSFGNLKQATLPDGRVVEYTTDGRHRRVQKRVNGTLVAQYLYINQLEPIAVLDTSGAIVASFVYADRPFTPSLMHKGGRTYKLVTDAIGSVRLVIDVADGAIAQRIDYDEFGRVLSDSNPGFQPFGFVGGLDDRDTGFVRLGARDYDPYTGRWMAKDEARFTAGTRNLYLYASGEPINRLDINGLAEICSRTLNGFPFKAGVLRHDHIWYEDGSNSGFFDNDRIRPDLLEPNDSDAGMRPKADYGDCRYIGPDDSVRMAEQRVQENWDNDWRLMSNDCQDYVRAVENDPILVDERIRPIGDVRTGDQ